MTVIEGDIHSDHGGAVTMIKGEVKQRSMTGPIERNEKE